MKLRVVYIALLAGSFHSSLLQGQTKAKKRREQADSTIQVHKAKIFDQFIDYSDSVAIQASINAILDIRPYYQDADDPEKLKEWVDVIRRKREKEMISSVSKFSQTVQEAPATVYTLSAEQIKARGYQHLEELFHDLPGFSVARSNGTFYSNIYQRGYRSSTSTDRTLILIDGVEDNSLFNGTAVISRQYSLENIRRIEFIYGPLSTMYGSNAHTGVINIITKSAEANTLTTQMHVSSGSWNTTSMDFLIRDKIGLSNEGFGLPCPLSISSPTNKI